jgi:hypothetical protein
MKNLQREHLKKLFKTNPRKVGPGLHFSAKNGLGIRGGSAPEIKKIEVLPAWNLICRHFLFFSEILSF